MKKIVFLLLSFVLSMVGAAAQAPGLFEKMYGDADDNYPTSVKAFGDGVYVTGYKVVNGTDYGTITKLDRNSGALLWEKVLEIPSRLVDVEYDPVNDQLLTIGHTTPFSAAVNNRSLFIKFDDQGNELLTHSYNHPGRELFNRIVRHPNPANAAFPYYILGVKNATSTPSSNDIVMLYNISAAGTANWSVEYAYSSNPTDDEFMRGLIPYANGNLLITGNGTNNDGIVAEVNGLSGTVIQAIRFAYPLDINGGVMLPSGNVVLCGTDFTFPGFTYGVMLLLDPGFLPLSRIQFSNTVAFEDVWLDQYGDLYAISLSKTSPTGQYFNLVHKMRYQFFGGPPVLNLQWSKYLDPQPPLTGHTLFSHGNLSVTTSADRIYYADARTNQQSAPPIIGGIDMLVGAYDLNLTSQCQASLGSPMQSLNMSSFPITVNSTGFTPVVPQLPTLSDPLQSTLLDFCTSVPCECDFTYTIQSNPCFTAQFTALCDPPQGGNYTYIWDFDCDQNPDQTVTVGSNTHTTSHTFDCGGGTFQVCLKVITPNGTVCNIIKPVTIPAVCCGPLISQTASCTPQTNIYRFSMEVGDPPGLGTCQQPTVVLNTSNATILPGTIFTYTGTSWIITGFVQLSTTLNTTALSFTVSSACTCLSTGAPFSCTRQIVIPLPCCKTIVVDDISICKEKNQYDVPLLIGAWPPLHNISQVSWYVIPEPQGGCPPTPWGGLPYQDNLTNTLEPLHLYPSSLDDRAYCVYAVVYLNDGPCMVLTSNIATIRFCDPTTCTTQDQEWCYTGSPVLPTPINLQLNATAYPCPGEIYWYDTDGNLVQTGGTMYTPVTPLSMTDPTQCFEDFYYTAEVVDSCGTHACKARVRLYSSTADIGLLEMAPDEPPFLCYGGDATLKFTPNCVGPPRTWMWYEQGCNGPAAPIPNNGNMNMFYNTNPLTSSMYYAVEAANGVCPPVRETLFVPVKSPLLYSGFTATYDPCSEQFVTLDLNIDPCYLEGCTPLVPCNCTYTVVWYKDGVSIGTSTGLGSGLASFTYTTLPLGGNYYAAITSECCGETLITPPEGVPTSCDPVVMGPCFICDDTKVTLMAQMVLPPDNPCPNEANCTFVWYELISGNWMQVGTGPTYMTMGGGHFLLESTCDGCVKTTPFDLLACSTNPCRRVYVEDLTGGQTLPVRIFPNPTSGDIRIEWLGGDWPKERRLTLVDTQGRVLRTLTPSDAETTVILHADDLPSGMYFIQIQSSEATYRAAKVIKE